MRVRRLDMGKYPHLSEFEALKAELEAAGLYKPTLLYSGCSGEEAEDLIKHDKAKGERIYCATESEISDYCEIDPFQYAKGPEPHMLIFDPRGLSEGDMLYSYELPSRNKARSLVAAFRLDYARV